MEEKQISTSTESAATNPQPTQDILISSTKEFKELEDRVKYLELTKSFEVILSVLLSISLASFLLISVEHIELCVD